jgi:hypothetical protein
LKTHFGEPEFIGDRGLWDLYLKLPLFIRCDLLLVIREGRGGKGRRRDFPPGKTTQNV